MTKAFSMKVIEMKYLRPGLYLSEKWFTIFIKMKKVYAIPPNTFKILIAQRMIPVFYSAGFSGIEAVFCATTEYGSEEPVPNMLGTKGIMFGC